MRAILLLVLSTLALAISETPLPLSSPASHPSKIKGDAPEHKVHLDLCDCEPATGDPGGLSCDKEGFFIAAFERQGNWVAGGGSVPLSRAICCRPCLYSNTTTSGKKDTATAADEEDTPLAVVSLGCHASTDPLGIRCETNSNSYVTGFTDAVHVFSSTDTQYPVDTAQCCTPALLMQSGNAYELERCDCRNSDDQDHPVSCYYNPNDTTSASTSTSEINDNISVSSVPSLLTGFDFFRVSPLGQVVPIGPAKCCSICLSEKIHPVADCSDLNHCSGNGVCFLGRCECLQGWGSPDCSQSLAGKGGWGGKIPPWAIALIVIGSCILAIALLSAAAHIAEIMYEVRGSGAGGGGRGSGESEDGDDSRRPLLLRIDADDAGSVGSEDTADLECNELEDVECVQERIEGVIHRLEEAAAATAAAEGEGQQQQEIATEEGEEEAAAGSSAAARPGALSTAVAADAAVSSLDEEEHQDIETGGTSAATAAAATGSDEIQKPGAQSGLQSYTGVGPLTGVDCVVCMIRPVQTVVVPCGHVCMCRRCSRRLNRCPICRKEIVRRQRLYV